MVLRRLLSNAASRFDRTIGAAMLVRGDLIRVDPASLSHEDRLRLLAEVRAAYSSPRYFEDPDSFFGPQTVARPTLTRVRLLPGEDSGLVLDATWESTHEPMTDLVRSDYLAHEENQTAAARLFLHTKPRPSAILVHGYRCGQFALEERIWPVEWLYEQGLDVALFVLPFHAVRARKKAVLFPSIDPRFTIEGFRQAVADLRALSGFLRERGSKAVGVMGMSLGGYTAGLYATADPTLDFAVPIIPCASLADIARTVGLLSGSREEQDAQQEALESTLRVTSPLARRALLPGDRILVVGGDADRITPLEHARRLATHFGAPLERFHGGHLLQFGRVEAFRSIGRMLHRIGVLRQTERHAA